MTVEVSVIIRDGRLSREVKVNVLSADGTAISKYIMKCSHNPWLGGL